MPNDDWNFRIQVGIETPAEEPKGVDEMRQAINLAARNSSLVNRCLTSAEHQGLSGEDKHVMLAYYALRSLQDVYSQHMDLIMRMPQPFTIPAKSTRSST